MSTTALVRSSSSSNSLTVQKPATPATTSPITLPKLNLTPRQISTPTGTPPSQQPSSPATPGRWQHPRMDEVIRRQSASNFDNSNVRTIGVNLVVLLLSVWLPSLIPTSLTAPLRPYDTYTLLTLRLLIVANISLAFTPLFRKPDLCEDIPLDPTQRSRLGLPPLNRPATPAEQAQYITPPRYSRSNTPRSNSGSPYSLRAQASGSPLSGYGTPMSPFGSGGQGQRRASGSPMTPSGTPSNAAAAGRRLSYNPRGSPLSLSEFDPSGTPTKVGNPRASVGLNSKWLYEKGRGSPTGGSGVGGGFGGGGWGTGSVFS
ncbi:uncharacterized protein LTR77_008013 [Saxophila tyrrhenica]|uniref:Uncharacterized protein n=1 Tax=Saxophila tyrrhenica TaxID=1690608 RepID=A0AAV9P1J7_9PEZI|nr:hypothetical protein LTR77_008013 [Saxophila tyrrhenica]